MIVEFQVGERVRLRTVSPVVGVGTVGTIQLVDRSVGDLYEVQFDGYARPRLMRARELERVTPVPAPASPERRTKAQDEPITT